MLDLDVVPRDRSQRRHPRYHVALSFKVPGAKIRDQRFRGFIDPSAAAAATVTLCNRLRIAHQTPTVTTGWTFFLEIFTLV